MSGFVERLEAQAEARRRAKEQADTELVERVAGIAQGGLAALPSRDLLAAMGATPELLAQYDETVAALARVAEIEP